MWKPNYEKTEPFWTRWLRALKGPYMAEETQFPWKQCQHIKQSQEPLSSMERIKTVIPEKAKTVYPKEASCEIRICGTGRDIAELYIYAARKDDFPVDVASGTIKTGPQSELRKGLGCYYVDNIMLTSKWLTDVKVINCPGSVSRIFFCTHGYNRIFVRIKYQTADQWFVDFVGA